jgi:hypothetical protein
MPGPKRSASSKRNSPEWAAATLFLRVEHQERMAKLLHLIAATKTTGEPTDQSEVIAAALGDYLDQHLPRIEQLAVKSLLG